MLQQIRIKYMTAIRKHTELRPEDTGAVRLALHMALEELHEGHRQQLNDMDDIIADLLEQRDGLKALAATDAGEILRLQTMEDRLTEWFVDNQPTWATDLHNTDVATAIIGILSKRDGAAVAPSPIDNGNGHVKITDLGTRYSGRRLNMSDEQIRSLTMAKIQRLAVELGRTPTKTDWNNSLLPDEPSLTSVQDRLHKNWNQLIKAAGLEPNLNSHQRAAQIAEQKEEAKADNAASPFRAE